MTLRARRVRPSENSETNRMRMLQTHYAGMSLT